MPETTLLMTLLLAGLILINLTALAIVLYDKRLSQQGSGVKRVPEGVFFFLAAACGSGGLYAGMLLFRHKTQKWYFTLGVPLLMLQNIATLYLIHLLFLE
jgi:uncharacterized membrane protein YsdA (DUF1294 family)